MTALFQGTENKKTPVPIDGEIIAIQGDGRLTSAVPPRLSCFPPKIKPQENCAQGLEKPASLVLSTAEDLLILVAMITAAFPARVTGFHVHPAAQRSIHLHGAYRFSPHYPAL
ncbi:MAG: hypothetical protein CVU43_00850 [Chloroflexi bacterium HGW-Chloroflexi-5]|nr:MAG: hypothetical protein CVU43_00850 [Chloroflexi bacterium HGW-Chloroflexi-5]